MTQWEYKIIKLSQSVVGDCTKEQTELYLLGREGWELTGVWKNGYTQAILKRPLGTEQKQTTR